MPLPRSMTNGHWTRLVAVIVDSLTKWLIFWVSLPDDITRGGAMSKSTAVSPRLFRYGTLDPVGGTAHGIGPTRHT